MRAQRRRRKVCATLSGNAHCGIACSEPPRARDQATLIAADILEEAIRAFVVLDDGAELTSKRSSQRRTRLENFMVPRDVVFISELPTTATGKVRKKSLVEAAG